MLRASGARCLAANLRSSTKPKSTSRAHSWQGQRRWVSTADKHQEHDLFFPFLVLGAGLAAAGFWLLKSEWYGGDRATAPFDTFSLREDLEKLFKENPDHMRKAVLLLWQSNGAFRFRRTGDERQATTGTVDTDHPVFKPYLPLIRSLSELKERYPIGTSDLWAFAAVTAVQMLGGPEVPYKFGRTDSPTAMPPTDGSQPEALHTLSEVVDVDDLRRMFYRKGLNDAQLVVLVGALRSLASQSQLEFSNRYFVDLTKTKWVKDEAARVYRDEKCAEHVVSLSDHLLLEDPMFAYWARAFAKDEIEFSIWFAESYAAVTNFNHAPWGPVPY
ncbi:Cytochrome c peroxidase [Diplonema papillatum]|nr:Cytochrome c peroxidase [Diplonema papillatum]